MGTPRITHVPIIEPRKSQYNEGPIYYSDWPCWKAVNNFSQEVRANQSLI